MSLQPILLHSLKQAGLSQIRFGNQPKPDPQTHSTPQAESPNLNDDSFELSPSCDPAHVFYEDPKAPALSQADTPTDEYEPIPPDRMGKLLSDMRSSPQVIQRAEVYEVYKSERKIHKNPFDHRQLYSFQLHSKRVRGSFLEFWRLNSHSGENIKVRDVSKNLPGTEVFYIDQSVLLPYALNLRNPVDPLTGDIQAVGYAHDPFPAYHPVRWGDGLYIDQNFIPLSSHTQPEQAPSVDLVTQQKEAREQFKLYQDLFQEDPVPPKEMEYSLSEKEDDQYLVSLPSVYPGFLVVARLLQDERYQNTLIEKYQRLLESSEAEARQDIQGLAQLAKGYLERSGNHVFYPADEKTRPIHWIDWE
jgi:hypothetical protein